MKTFNDVKNEILIQCNNTIENLKRPTTMTPDFLNGWRKELTDTITNIEESTKKEIQRRTQHIIDMANAGKPLQDIIGYNLLGINADDIDLISIINKCIEYRYNSIFEKELKDAIENKMEIQQVKENETNKMGM